MKSAYYACIIEPFGDGFFASFPDFPECVAYRGTVFGAVRAGKEALELHIRLLVREGREVPKPSNILPPVSKTGWSVMVTIPDRTIRLNISMEAGLVERIDRVATNRSQFLAEAARAKLKKMGVTED